jgi:2-amino-4-hydroxy-6-hydroxymethyldihydropteridine diphosphokinase
MSTVRAASTGPVHAPVVLGLGANLGDALTQLAAAVELIGEIAGVVVEEVSSIYSTPPWPPAGDPRHVPQDDFLNLVVRARATIGPEELLAATLELERLLGRDRANERRWGPRPIDIDLLVHGEEVRDLPELTVPHPRITERAFVMVPLLEVWAGATLPPTGDGLQPTRVAAALATLASSNPVEDIRLVGRIDDAPTTHLARPDGPTAPAAGFVRPGLEDVAREHGASA